MAAIRKLGSKLFFNNKSNRLDTSKEILSDSDTTNSAKDEAILPAASQPFSKPTIARSMKLTRYLSSMPGRIRRSASHVGYYKPDVLENDYPDTPGLQTPKKRNTLWGRASLSRSWANRNSAQNSKRRNIVRQECCNKSSKSPPLVKQHVPTVELGPFLNVDTTDLSLDQSAVEVMSRPSNTGDRTPSVHQLFEPKMFWPCPTQSSVNPQDPIMEQLAPDPVTRTRTERNDLAGVRHNCGFIPDPSHLCQHCKSNVLLHAIQVSTLGEYP